jgi:hypothetical protein
LVFFFFLLQPKAIWWVQFLIPCEYQLSSSSQYWWLLLESVT